MVRQQAKGPSQRQLRVGEMLRHALAEILTRADIADPELEGRYITVTEVKTSPDLRHATVFARPFGKDQDDGAIIKALNRHQRFLRGELGRRVDLKFIPEPSSSVLTKPSTKRKGSMPCSVRRRCRGTSD